jgi:hypothetical protein
MLTRGDPDVSFIDTRAFGGGRGSIFEFIALFLGGIPKSGVIGG